MNEKNKLTLYKRVNITSNNKTYVPTLAVFTSIRLPYIHTEDIIFVCVYVCECVCGVVCMWCVREREIVRVNQSTEWSVEVRCVCVCMYQWRS